MLHAHRDVQHLSPPPPQGALRCCPEELLTGGTASVAEALRCISDLFQPHRAHENIRGGQREREVGQGNFGTKFLTTMK